MDEVSSSGEMRSGRAVALLHAPPWMEPQGEAGEAAKEATTVARLAAHATGRAMWLLGRLKTSGGLRRSELALALAHLCFHACAML